MTNPYGGGSPYGSGVPPDDTAYDATTWNGSLRPATKNALRDKLETMAGEPGNTLRVAESGADYTTISTAVTAASDGDTILIYPGTYTETITIANWNLTFIGMGSPNSVIVTQVAANVVNFGGYTGTVFRNISFSVTAATLASQPTITGALGTATFEECKISMTCAYAIGAGTQPACGRLTAAGTLNIKGGSFVYAHTGACNPAISIKAAFLVENAGTIHLHRLNHSTVVNSGDALASAAAADLGTSGNIEVIKCDVTVTDPNCTLAVGLGYLAGTGVLHEFHGNTIHVVATANTGYGIYLADTASLVRSYFNHIHVVDTGGLSYAFYHGTGSTIESHFDDLVAADGSTGSGTLSGVFSEEDGNLTVTQAFETADLILGQPNIHSVSNAFQDFDAAEAKTYNLTGLLSNSPVIRYMRLWISNDPGADQNLNFILTFYKKDTMLETDRICRPRYFNLTYTETNGGITATDTTDVVDSGAGLIDGDKVYLMGGTAEIVTLTAVPTATGLTFTEAALDHTDNTGIVRIYEITDLFEIIDEDVSNEIHMRLECLDTPNAATNVGFWLETQ